MTKCTKFDHRPILVKFHFGLLLSAKPYKNSNSLTYYSVINYEMMNWNKHGSKNCLTNFFFWILSGKFLCKFNKWTKYTKIPIKNFDPTKSMVQIRLHNFNVCLNLFIANDWLKAIAEQQYIETKYQNRIQQIVRQSVVIHACIRRLSV